MFQSEAFRAFFVNKVQLELPNEVSKSLGLTYKLV